MCHKQSPIWDGVCVVWIRKKVRVKWGTIDRRLRTADGLDDIMLFDLGFLCKQMQPPVEKQYR